MARFITMLACLAMMFVSAQACHQGRIAQLMRLAAQLRNRAASVRRSCGNVAAAARMAAQARNYQGMYNTLYNRYTRREATKNLQSRLQAHYNRLIATKKSYLGCFKSTRARRLAAHNAVGQQQAERAKALQRVKAARAAAKKAQEQAAAKRLRVKEAAQRQKKLAQLQAAAAAKLARQRKADSQQRTKVKVSKTSKTQQSTPKHTDLDDLFGDWEPATQQSSYDPFAVATVQSSQPTDDFDLFKGGDTSAKGSTKNMFDDFFDMEQQPNAIFTQFEKRDTIGIARRARAAGAAALSAATIWCRNQRAALAQAQRELARWKSTYLAYRRKVGSVKDLQKWLSLHAHWRKKSEAERRHNWTRKLQRCRAYSKKMPADKTVEVGGNCIFTWDCKTRGSFCSSGGKGIGRCFQKCTVHGARRDRKGRCLDAPPKHQCFVNRQCRSYFCKDGKCAHSMIGIDRLARCASNSDCMKGSFCYRFAGKSRGKYGHCQQICSFKKHQRGSWALRVGGYCHNAPGGHKCFIDSQCYTGKCRSNHECAYDRNAPAGHPCLSHSMCRSGYCGVHGNGVRRCM